MAFEDISEAMESNLIADTIKELIRDNEYISEFASNGPGVLFYKERGKRREIEIPMRTEEEYNASISSLIKL